MALKPKDQHRYHYRVETSSLPYLETETKVEHNQDDTGQLAA
jgi:hypothetical protein